METKLGVGVDGSTQTLLWELSLTCHSPGRKPLIQLVEQGCGEPNSVISTSSLFIVMLCPYHSALFSSLLNDSIRIISLTLPYSFTFRYDCTWFSNQILMCFCIFKNTNYWSFGKWDMEIQSLPPSSMAFAGLIKGTSRQLTFLRLCMFCALSFLPWKQ